MLFMYVCLYVWKFLATFVAIANFSWVDVQMCCVPTQLMKMSTQVRMSP